MARSKHNKAAQKPIKPAQTTSKKKTLKKQTKIKIEGASQATPAQQVPDWQETPDCKITKLKLCCDGSCPIGAEGQPYTTADKSNFKRHMQNWHGDKGYGNQALKFPVVTGGCTVCKAGFKTAQALLRHYGGKFCFQRLLKVKIKCDSVVPPPPPPSINDNRWWPEKGTGHFNVLVPHPEGNRVIGRRAQINYFKQTLKPLKNDSNWGMPLVSVMVCTAIPFMEQATDTIRDYLDKQDSQQPPRVASSVMYNLSQEEKLIKILDMRELTRERVVSKLMLDMVYLVEAIHFELDGSMFIRDIDGEHGYVQDGICVGTLAIN